jgi:hypothetical protein
VNVRLTYYLDFISTRFLRSTTYEINTHEVHAHEGFCEDLARQNIVAHLSQLQLQFRRRHIWVSVIAVVS